MIENILIAKLIEVAVERVGDHLSEKEFNLASNKVEIEKALNSHLKIVKNWAEEVSFKDLSKSKSINSVYVNLDLNITPRKNILKEYDDNVSIKFNDLPFNKHIIILGQPGAGKTTSLKYLTYKMLFDDNPKFKLERFNYPVLIKFRELDNLEDDNFLLNKLISIYGISVRHKQPEKFEKLEGDYKILYEQFAHLYIQEFINSQRVVLILDGFDELPSIKAKENAIKSIRSLSARLENSLIIMTSRSSDYEYHIDGTEVYEISPLNDDQIRKFAIKWLGNKQKSEDFLSKVKQSPFYDTTIRPLTIAHLCSIYERRGDIPRKPKTIYKKLINLFLEEWDFQRSVKRNSQYADFEVDRKFDFLSSLSYDLTTYFNISVFTSRQLERSYNRIHVDFDLPKHESGKVVKELESHSGLIIQSGYDNFMFAHKSLQEFFTANYLVKLPEFPRDIETVNLLPNEFAIAISISSNSSKYFEKFINDFVVDSSLSESFLATFINRLILEKPDFSHRPAIIFKFSKLYEIYFKKLTQHVDNGTNMKVFDIITPTDSEPLWQILIELENLILALVSRGEEFRTLLSRNYKIIESNNFNIIYRKLNECEGPKKLYLPNKT